ncbi:MAG: AraC family transcriptional regulator [Pseudomonadales bacterium]|nr:AraC family transcriptional regulator [Pseudomonadales bacterium]
MSTEQQTRNRLMRYPALFSRTYLAVLASWGVNIEDFLSASDLPADTATRSLGLTQEEYQRLLDAVHQQFADRGPGLEMGWQLPPTAFGSLGQATLSSANFGAALAVCERYWNLFGMGMACNLNIAPELSHIEIMALPEIPHRHHHMVLESTLTSVYRGCVALLPEVQGQTITEFTFAEPVYAGKARHYLGTVRYAQSGCRISFPTALLDQPLMMANAFALQTALLQCEQDQQLNQHPGFAGRIRKELVLTPEGYPSFDQLADKLHMSPRTLRRYLQNEGASFLKLLNDARKRDAQNLLERPELAIQDVAQRLGYNDPANFTRAFRLWLGLTPSQYREQKTAP